MYESKTIFPPSRNTPKCTTHAPFLALFLPFLPFLPYLHLFNLLLSVSSLSLSFLLIPSQFFSFHLFILPFFIFSSKRHHPKGEGLFNIHTAGFFSSSQFKTSVIPFLQCIATLHMSALSASVCSVCCFCFNLIYCRSHRYCTVQYASHLKYAYLLYIASPCLSCSHIFVSTGIYGVNL